MARISKTMLNKSDKSGQPCLIQIIRIFQVMLSVFTVENEMVFAMGLLHGLYYVAVGSLYVLFLESFFFFNHKWMLNFAKRLFCIYWDYHIVFILQFVNVVYHIDWFAYTEEFLHHWEKSTWSWFMILLRGCWIQFVSLVLRILYLCSSVIWACNFLFYVTSLSGFGTKLRVTS